MAHRLSLAHLSVIELTPPDVVSAAAAAGFSAVNLRLAPVAPGEAPHPIIGDTPMRRETLRRLRDTGLIVHDVEIIRLKGNTDATGFHPLLETARVLGARHMLVAGDEPDEAAIADRYAELCEIAEAYEINAALEFMPWTGIKTIHSARRVLAIAGVGSLIVDALHLARSGGSAADLAALPPAKLAYFQICDAPAQAPEDEAGLIFQARQARMAPGKGGLGLVAMLRKLPDDLVVSIEVPMAAMAKTADAEARARLLMSATKSVMSQAGLPAL
jgi:sugar phosphate isomerase/epimerase